MDKRKPKPKRTIMVPAIALGLIPTQAWATGITPVPEPDVLSLLAIGAAVGVVISLRNRRNNKNKK
jgi:hypothetical protein